MIRSSDLTIAQRLARGFGLVFLCLAVLAIAVFVWHRASSRAQLAFVEHFAPLSDQAHTLERNLLNVEVSARTYFLAPTVANRQQFDQHAANARNSLSQLDDAAKAPGDFALYGEMRQRALSFLSAVEQAVTTFVPSSEISAAASADLTEVRELAVASVRRFASRQQDRAAAQLALMAEARDKMSSGLLVTSAVAALLSLVVAYLTTRSIRKPTKALLATAVALEHGNWVPALQLAPSVNADAPAGRSEMARLARAIGSAAAALERRERRVRADGEVAHATASSLDGETLASAALHAVMGYVQAEVGVVYRHDVQSGTLRPIARYALDESLAPVHIGEGIPGQAAKTLRPVVVRDIPRDSGFDVKIGYDASPPRTVAALPILFGRTLHGVLLVASVRELDEDAMRFLSSASAQIGIGLQNVAAYEEIQRLLSEVRDKNQQIQAQNEELQAQNEEIQAQAEAIQAQSEELREHSEKLRRHAAMLAEADERKNQFLGVLAHELRNPMAPLTNCLAILRRAPPGSEQAQRAQAVLERQARHLTRLIDDLLDITRVSQGKIRLEREVLDLVDIVHACVEDQLPAIEERALELDVTLPDEPLRVNGDRTRLCQVLGNLLSNAIKFTDRGGRISLALWAEAAAGRAVLRVKDNGIGMEADLLSRLFQPFNQGASGLARGNGGLGLGLALVKALVELHGGTVEAHSDGPGTGSQFIVRLPLLTYEQSAAGESATVNPST